VEEIGGSEGDDGAVELGEVGEDFETFCCGGDGGEGVR
jgi:hypothetical protein